MLQGKANKPCWVLSGTVFHTRARALLLPPHQWSTLTPGCFGRCSRLRTGPPTSRALRWRSTLCCVGLYCAMLCCAALCNRYSRHLFPCLALPFCYFVVGQVQPIQEVSSPSFHLPPVSFGALWEGTRYCTVPGLLS